MPNNNRQLPYTDILRVHAEDAAFLIELHAKALEAPNYRLVDIYDLERRIIAHMDALALSGATGEALTHEQLDEVGGPGEVFVASHLCLRNGQPQTLGPILDVVGGDPARLAGFSRAVAWCSAEALSRVMTDWITSADHRLAWAALDVCGSHRVDPRHHLQRLIVHHREEVRARAWRLAGECGRADLLGGALEALPDGGRVGFEAAWAATLLGDRSAAPLALMRTPLRGTSTSAARRAAELGPLGLEETEAMNAIRELLSVAEGLRWGIVALGALGRAGSLPWLQSRMDDPLLARVAGAALVQITGVHLGLDELELDEFPDDPENPILDDDGVEAFAETNTPWPDPDRVAAWLAANLGRFAVDTHHLFGVAAWTRDEPVGPFVAHQSRFRVVAYELALRSPTTPLPNWRAPVFLSGGRFTRAW